MDDHAADARDALTNLRARSETLTKFVDTGRQDVRRTFDSLDRMRGRIKTVGDCAKCEALVAAWDQAIARSLTGLELQAALAQEFRAFERDTKALARGASGYPGELLDRYLGEAFGLRTALEESGAKHLPGLEAQAEHTNAWRRVVAHGLKTPAPAGPRIRPLPLVN